MNRILFFSWIVVVALSLPLTSSLSNQYPKTTTTDRRSWFQQAMIVGGAIATTGTVGSATAAPPIAVIAEELGYFPVQNREGQVVYIPKKVRRKSTDQAIELAKRMQEKGISMYGAFWCPHCSRQKELFGQEAWSYINYVECSPKGYGFKGTCKNIDGYPTFKDKRGKINFSGERPLEYLAKEVGFKGFDPTLEDPVPMDGAACRQ